MDYPGNVSNGNVAHSEHDLNNNILMLYHRGAISEAEHASKQYTQYFPESSFGWKMLGICCAMQGRPGEAVSALEVMVSLTPHDHEAHGNLALALQQDGKLEAAIAEFKVAISLNPRFAEAHFNLGNLYKSQKNLPDAIECYKQAIEHKPDFFMAYLNLGNTESELEHKESARSTYERLIGLDPGNIEAHNNLGVLLDATGQHVAARVCYQRAIQLKPDFFEAHINMGDSFRSEYLEEEAISSFRQALASRHGSAEAHFKLANCLQAIGAFPDAITSFRHALAIAPDFTEAYFELGRSLDSIAHHSEAMACYAKALELNPDYLEVYHHRAIGFSNIGEHDRTLESFRRALDINPASEHTYHGLLCCINYHPDLRSEEIYSYYREYAEKLTVPMAIGWVKHNNKPLLDKRLKIGYVAATFYQHSSKHFLEPLLSNHDKSQVEVYAYAQARPFDNATIQYQSYVDHWVVTRGMTDDELAERIGADGIDILVDIAGHTGHNRLQVFARKPAPVSLHWLDFGYTTGLKAIDYYLTDEPTVPEGSEHLFSETPWKLPVPAYAYRPAEGMGEVSALPAHQRGYITFGTLTRAVRINHRTIRVWSEILKAVPGSHLIINSVSFSNPEMQKRMIERFAEHGVTHERLEIGMTSPPWDVLRGIDIGLDCFPHNSGTTLFETLYMGIPFVTLASRPSVGRLGASILHGLGHPEWIAETEEEYISKVIALAGDIEQLAGLRRVLRQEMEQSPLMDEVGFARAVEDAYRQMWKRWCAS